MNISRKKFMLQTGLTGAAICCGGGMISLLSACGGLKTIEATVKDKKIELKKRIIKGNNYIIINSLQLKGPVLLSKDKQGLLTAVLMICTHRSCELNLVSDKLICPCHGSEFSQNGKVTLSPAQEDLHQFKISTDDDYIYIHTN